MDQKKINLIETVKKSILNRFYFLESDFLYTPLCKIEKSDLFIDSLDVEYVNEIKRRTIIISYTRSNRSSEDSHTLTTSIIRMPYSGVEDFFELDIYLSSLGKNFKTNLIGHFNQEEVENLLKKIANALKQYTIDIIDGKLWRETYFPRKD